jgi:hypothetical protein
MVWSAIKQCARTTIGPGALINLLADENGVSRTQVLGERV